MRKFDNDKNFTALLENGKSIKGKYLEIPLSGTFVKKVFFKTPDNKKEFCVKNLSVDVTKPDWEASLKSEINDFLIFLLSQSKLEFPEWLRYNGKQAFSPNSSYSVSEIESEWKSMKSLFGGFRLAGDCGFFSSRKPSEAALNKIVEIKEIK